MQFFRNLQRKPKNVRQNYALAFSVAFTGVVASVWLMGMVTQSSFSGGKVVEAGEASTPFSNLFKQSKEQLANLKDSMKQQQTDVSTGSTTEEIDATNTNPMNITLSQEDIVSANGQQASSSYNYISTSTNSFESKPSSREVMIATTSSSSTKKQLEGSASTSNSSF